MSGADDDGAREAAALLAALLDAVRAGHPAAAARELCPLLAGLERGLFELVVDGWAPLLNDAVYPDAWRDVCATRSGIQAAVDHCWGGVVPDALAEDLAQFDFELERAGARDAPLAPEEVPPDVPASHWWWFVPYRERPR